MRPRNESTGCCDTGGNPLPGLRGSTIRANAAPDSNPVSLGERKVCSRAEWPLSPWEDQDGRKRVPLEGHASATTSRAKPAEIHGLVKAGWKGCPTAPSQGSKTKDANHYQVAALCRRLSFLSTRKSPRDRTTARVVRQDLILQESSDDPYLSSAAGLLRRPFVAKLSEQILHFARAKIGLGVIEWDGAMQTALRCLEPLTRFVQAAKEMHRVAE